jgi:hypothetical protein
MSIKKFETLKQAIQEVDQHPSLALSVFSKEIKKNYRIFLVATKVKGVMDAQLNTNFIRLTSGPSTRT